MLQYSLILWNRKLCEYFVHEPYTLIYIINIVHSVGTLCSHFNQPVFIFHFDRARTRRIYLIIILLCKITRRRTIIVIIITMYVLRSRVDHDVSEGCTDSERIVDRSVDGATVLVYRVFRRGWIILDNILLLIRYVFNSEKFVSTGRPRQGYIVATTREHYHCHVPLQSKI